LKAFWVSINPDLTHINTFVNSAQILLLSDPWTLSRLRLKITLVL
jgi:hypothetical protein